MVYLIGEQFSGNLGNLSCQLLGSVEAANGKQALREATHRWPGRDYCIYKLPKRSKSKSRNYSSRPFTIS